MKISDFAGRDGMIDVPELMRLTDSEFASALFEESRKYMENHGKTVFCRDCDMPVSAPEDLVRYFGMNMHGACFIEAYETERERHHLSDGERAYFDRVLKVVQARNRKEFDF